MPTCTAVHYMSVLIQVLILAPWIPSIHSAMIFNAINNYCLWEAYMFQTLDFSYFILLNPYNNPTKWEPWFLILQMWNTKAQRGFATHWRTARLSSSPECVCVCVCVCVCATQSCLTLCDPMDCRLPGSSVHGIFQARILEWDAISSSRGSSRLKDWICISCISCLGRWILYHRTTSKAHSLPEVEFWTWVCLTLKSLFLIMAQCCLELCTRPYFRSCKKIPGWYLHCIMEL